MAISVTLNNLANLQNENTAVSSINANSATITQGFTTALNTAGDTMLGTLNMNSFQITNLPAPGTANSPARLQDLITVTGGGTSILVPTIQAGSNIVVTNATTATPTVALSNNISLIGTTSAITVGGVTIVGSATGSVGVNTSGANVTVQDIGNTFAYYRVAGNGGLNGAYLFMNGVSSNIGFGGNNDAGVVANNGSSGRLVLGAGGLVSIISYSSGGVFIGGGAADPGNGNLTVSGKITASTGVFSGQSGQGGNITIGGGSSFTTFGIQVQTTSLVFVGGSNGIAFYNTGLSRSNFLVDDSGNGTFNGTCKAVSFTGAVPVASLNSGSNASAGTFWRGDGSWAATPAGNLVNLTTLTASTTATLGLSSIFSSNTTYTGFEIVFQNIIAGTTAGGTLGMQFYSGSTLTNTGYQAVSFFADATSNSFVSGTTTAFFPISAFAGSSTAGPGVSGKARIYNPSATSNLKMISGEFAQNHSSATMAVGSFGGWWSTNTTAVPGFALLYSGTATIASGIITVYGIV